MSQRSGQRWKKRKMSRASLVAAYCGICTIFWYIMDSFRSELGRDGYMVRFCCVMIHLPRVGSRDSGFLLLV